jgi:hypothetical protein
MEIITLDDAISEQPEVTFRESASGRLMLPLATAALAVGILVARKTIDLPLPMVCISVGGALLIVVLGIRAFIRTLASSNWMMIVSDGHICINLKLSSGSRGDEKQVVKIPFSDMESVGIVKITRLSQSMNRSTRMDRTSYLEIRVDEAELEQIEKMLKKRAAIRTGPPGGYSPVTVKDNAILLTWTSSVACIKPGLKKAVELLQRRHVKIKPLIKKTHDFRIKKAGSDTNHEAQILELVESGNYNGALKLVMKLYDLNLADARQFVNELQNKKTSY